MKKFLHLALIIIVSLFSITSCNSTKEEKKELNGTLIVANKSGNNISIIDRGSGKTIKTLPTGLQPHEVEVSYDGKYAVVSNYGDRENPGNSLSVYDIQQGELFKTIDLGKNTRPHGMQWLKGTNKLLVTTEGSNSLLLVDIKKGKMEKQLNTGQEISHMVAATPDANFAFVSSIQTGNVTVFNLESGELGELE